MKALKFIGIGLLCLNQMYSQSVELTHQVSFVDMDDTTYTRNTTELLNLKQKNQLLKNLNKHFKDTSDYNVIYFPDNSLTKKDDSFFKFNGQYFSTTNKLWPDGAFTDAYLIDGYLHKVSNKSSKEPLSELFNCVYLNEKWTYKNNSLTKENVFLQIGHKLPFHNTLSAVFMGIVPQKKELKGSIFLENISYDYIFEPEMSRNDQELKLSEIKPLLMNIVKDVHDGKLVITDLNNKPINYNDKLVEYSEKIQLWDSEKDQPAIDDKGNPVYIEEKSSYKLENIVGIRFEEEWLLSDVEFNIVKKVKSITLLVEGSDQQKPLPFKIKF